MIRFVNKYLLTCLAWLNVVVHVTGLVFAVLALRHGSPLVELAQRLEYLARRPLGWSLGWGVWMVCTLALVVFFAALAQHLQEHADLARLAVTLAGAGGAVDLFCDVINITVLPLLASAGSSMERSFVMMERASLAGGLVVANGLYSLGTLLLTWCLSGRKGQSPVIPAVGYAVFGFGMLMVVAGFADLAWLAAVATGPTIGLFCVWTVLVARSFERSGEDAYKQT